MRTSDTAPCYRQRGILSHDAAWFVSPDADAAIDAALSADYRRTWDPRRDSPSLATLAGKAKDYGGHYIRSRASLLTKAGVTVREHRAHSTGAVAWIVTMPGERLSSAVRVDIRARQMVSA